MLAVLGLIMFGFIIIMLVWVNIIVPNRNKSGVKKVIEGTKKVAEGTAISAGCLGIGILQMFLAAIPIAIAILMVLLVLKSCA